MNSTVIDQVDTDDFFTIRFENLGNGKTKKVIPDMTQMKGFVCIGGRIFDHNGPGIGNNRRLFPAGFQPMPKLIQP
jgi:hypothetical protein